MKKIVKGMKTLLQRGNPSCVDVTMYTKLTEKKQAVIKERRKLLEEKTVADKHFKFRMILNGKSGLLSTENVVARLIFNKKESKIKVTFLEDKIAKQRLLGSERYGNSEILGGNKEWLYIYLQLEKIATEQGYKNYEFNVFGFKKKPYLGKFNWVKIYE